MDRTRNLDAVFQPASVAIAGVGPMTAGKCYLNSLLDSGFKGPIYSLNSRGGSDVDGHKIYPSIKDVPGKVDYVISCIPAAHLPQLIRDAACKEVKVLSMFTSGFSETGRNEARALEEEIRALARERGIRLLGPNCMGVYSPASGLSFVSDFPREKGKVAFVCQSGGHAIYFTRMAAQRGVRFSKVISYGNASDINESDLFEYLMNDPDTEIVASYIEGVRNGTRFARVVKELASKKPVLMIKGGFTPYGARAAASHTASMAGSDEVWDHVLRQSGVIRVPTLEELCDLVVTFLFLPLPRGRRVAMAGGGGGATVLATDACAASGFTLPDIPPDLDAALRRYLDSDAGLILTNPIEYNMLPEVTYGMGRTMLEHEAFDFMLVNCVFGQAPWPAYDFWFDNVCNTTLRVHSAVAKPIAVVLISDLAAMEEHRDQLRARYVTAGLPVYHSMQAACRAIDRFMRYRAERP